MFLKVVTDLAGSTVNIREVDANLEDEAFARAVEEACLELFPSPKCGRAPLPQLSTRR